MRRAFAIGMVLIIAVLWLWAFPVKAGSWQSAEMTWYGPGFYGNRTACGERLTRPFGPGTGLVGVAHKTLPCGTRIEIRYHHRTWNVKVV